MPEYILALSLLDTSPWLLCNLSVTVNVSRVEEPISGAIRRVERVNNVIGENGV